MKVSNEDPMAWKARVRASYDPAGAARVPMPHLSAVRCESPIEDAMFTALTGNLNVSIIRKQVAVGPYRVDFLIGKDACAPAVVVECDGRRFHDQTGEQNQRDRVRDRFMQRRGMAVLRYSGVEIKASPYACAEEVAAVYLNRVKHHRDGAE